MKSDRQRRQLLNLRWGLLLAGATLAVTSIQAEDKYYPILPATLTAGPERQPQTAGLTPVEIWDHSGPVARKTATTWWGWTPSGLWLTAEVQDQTPARHPGPAANFKNGCQYDALEFWVGERQFCAGLTEQGPAFWAFGPGQYPSGGEVTGELTQTGYRLAVFLPWAAVGTGLTPAAGLGFKLAVGVDDRQPDQTVIQAYAPTRWVWGRPESFAPAELASEFAAARHTQKFEPQPARIVLPNEPNLTAHLKLSVTSPLRPVRRSLLGVFAFSPPWGNTARYRPFLEQSSLRVCVRADKKWNAAWGELRNAVGATEIIGFTDKSWHPEKVYYRSEADHNLFPYQAPEAWTKLVVQAARDSGVPLNGYEIWNEPEFRQNGAWEAADYARYVADCSRRLRTAQPDLRVGAFFTSSQWNREFLAALPPDAVQFVDHHYYNTRWFSLGLRGEPAFVGKAVYDGLLRDRIRADREDLRAAGRPDLELITTEWGIHPKTYNPPFDVCHDIGAVLYHAAALLTFFDEDLAAAHYFHLCANSEEKPLAHFRLINPAAAETATGNLQLFCNFGAWFKGDLLPVTAASPTLQFPGAKGEALTAPLLRAGAARWADGRTLCLVLINRHPAAALTVAVEDLEGEWRLADTRLGTAADLDTPEVKFAPAPESGGGWSARRLLLPPHSVLFCRLEAAAPATGK